MNDNIYTLLNEMDHEAENYETWDVSADEVCRWKTGFYLRRRNETRRNMVSRYVAVAAVVLVIMFAMSPLRSQVYAKIIAVTSDIKEWFSINNVYLHMKQSWGNPFREVELQLRWMRLLWMERM